MARRRRRGGSSDLLERAAAETQLRYGGEIRGLRTLLREARTDYRIGVKAEKGAAEGIRAGVKAARPEIQRVYADAGESAAKVDTDVNAALAGLGASADPYKAISATEAAAAKRRLGEAMARADTDLASRGVAAEEGRAFAVKNLRSKYEEDRGKIREQKGDLEKEMGLFAQQNFRELTDAEAQLALERKRIRVSIRGQNITLRGQDLSNQQKDEDQALARAKERRARREAREEGEGKNKWTPTQLQDARAMWRKGLNLTEQGDPNGDERKEWITFLVGKGIDEPVARGVTQTYLDGGVSGPTRRYLQHNYGLKPERWNSKRRVGRFKRESGLYG